MPESLGFPKKIVGSQPPTPTVKPESKGRIFIGLLLLALIGFVAHNVWNTYFRYVAHGVVSGRLLNVSPPINGTLQNVYVKEGDHVQQGQILATIENVELRHRYDLLRDEILIESANLTSALAKLKLEYAFKLDNSQGTIAIYTETLARLSNDEANLIYLEGAYERNSKSFSRGTLSENEHSQSKQLYEGHKSKIVLLREAVSILKTRVDQLVILDDKTKILTLWHDSLRPFFVKIESLQNSIRRVQEQLSNCYVISPVSGIVVKRWNFSGETVNTTNFIFTIIADKSEFIIIYVPQEAVAQFVEGTPLELTMAPNSESVLATVQRRGDKYEPAPESIKRHYNNGQQLLPIYCKIDREEPLQYGAVLKLPYKWSK